MKKKLNQQKIGAYHWLLPSGRQLVLFSTGLRFYNCYVFHHCPGLQARDKASMKEALAKKLKRRGSVIFTQITIIFCILPFRYAP